jgi:hypothetical protein
VYVPLLFNSSQLSTHIPTAQCRQCYCLPYLAIFPPSELAIGPSLDAYRLNIMYSYRKQNIYIGTRTLDGSGVETFLPAISWPKETKNKQHRAWCRSSVLLRFRATGTAVTGTRTDVLRNFDVPVFSSCFQTIRMLACIRTYIHTYTYIHTCMHTYTYMHKYIRTYIHVHTYIHSHTHTHTHTHSCNSFTG